MALKHLQCGAYANNSERHAAEYLKTRLQNHSADHDWILLTNYANSSNSQYLSDEIDLIVIAPSGVILIEIKHWHSADLKGARVSVAEAEAEKLNDKAKRLKGKLARACSFDFGFVAGKLLLTKGENEKYAEGISRRRFRGVDVFGLSEWKDLLEVSLPPILTNEQIDHISRVLHPQAVALANDAIQNFDNTFFELRPIRNLNTPFRRIYHARRKPGRDKVLLHIYDLTASAEKNAVNIARREFEILQRLQKSIWLPNLMDSFQEARNYPGELYFFSYIDTESPTLAERSKDVSWELEERIFTTLRCVEALAQIHSERMGEEAENSPVLHRNLTPETIHVRSNNEPLLTQLHLAKIPGAQTVAAIAPKDAIGTDEFFAPEVQSGGISESTIASDIYSLCASLRVIFAEAPPELQTPQIEEILELLKLGLAHDSTKRVSLDEIYNGLHLIFAEPTIIEKKVLPVEYWDEDTTVELNDRFYRIITKLGSGGFGTTFKVMEINPKSGDDLSGPYVAKAITNEVAGLEAARAYAKVRAQTGTAHLAGVLEVASNWEPNSVTALLRWIKGEPLDELTGVLPLYFDDLGGESHEETTLMWLSDMCDALAQLHEVGLVHGDVSPRNIIVDGSSITLTDFDTATAAGSMPLGRTDRYCSPEIGADLPVSFSDDVFALAATFFHTLFDRFPFQYGNIAQKDLGLNWDGLDQSSWKRLQDFFDRATHPDRNNRFSSAMEAQTFLRGLIEPETVSHEAFATESVAIRTENVIPWLSQLMQSYPGSPKGNAETRGLDSEFARNTYVETALDEILAKDIKDRKVSLVILCGNAGDGKTAFLQNLAYNLGLEVGVSSQRIWNKSLADGLRVYANLDGSAAFQGRSANELVDECLAPFQDGDFPANVVHLLAINDGKLLEWLNESPDTDLAEYLYAALGDDDSTELNDRIRFIDLNKRSLVGGFQASKAEISADFVDRLLLKMLGGDTDVWQPCNSCTAQTRCHAWTSVETLREPERGPVLRERLTRALLAVHQRGEIHITARSLRATLVYMFFGTVECQDLHENPNLFPPMYFDRAFDFASPLRQGDLLSELSRLDPALESHPDIDRLLLNKAEAEFGQDNQLKGQPSLDSLRRKAYFEWTRDEIERIGGSETALGLAKSEYLQTFLQVAKGNESEIETICWKLCEGIAKLEDLPAEAFESDMTFLPLKITPRTPTETAFWVSKARDKFRLRPRTVRAVEGIETLHTHVILSYTFDNGHIEELVIGAELFNLLMELREGFQISDAQSDDTFANLSIFKQRLAQEGDRILFAWNPANERVMKLNTAMVDGVQKLIIAPSLIGETI